MSTFYQGRRSFETECSTQGSICAEYMGGYFFTAKSVVMGIFFMLYARVYKELIRKSSQNCQEWSKLSFIVKKLSETLINIQIVINMAKYRDNCGKMFVKICRYGPTTKKIWVGGWVFLSGPHIPTIFLDKLKNQILNLNVLKSSRMTEFLIVHEWVISPWLKKNIEFECSEMLQNEEIFFPNLFLSRCFCMVSRKLWIGMLWDASHWQNFQSFILSESVLLPRLKQILNFLYCIVLYFLAATAQSKKNWWAGNREVSMR